MLRLSAALAGVGVPNTNLSGQPSSASGHAPVARGGMVANGPPPPPHPRSRPASSPWGSGAAPPARRSSKALGRNSAPMRYTYGGGPSGGGGGGSGPNSRSGALGSSTGGAAAEAMVMCGPDSGAGLEAAGMALSPVKGGACSEGGVGADFARPTLADWGRSSSSGLGPLELRELAAAAAHASSGGGAWDEQSEMSFRMYFNRSNADNCSVASGDTAGDEGVWSTSLERLPVLSEHGPLSPHPSFQDLDPEPHGYEPRLVMSLGVSCQGAGRGGRATPACSLGRARLSAGLWTGSLWGWTWGWADARGAHGSRGLWV
jgi:hypothetical protein